MGVKRFFLGLLILIFLFFASIFSRSYFLYYNLRSNKGYCFGKVISVWENKMTHTSRYEYKVNEITYTGRYGAFQNIGDSLFIVYDKINPQFSIVPKYPLPYKLSDENQTLILDILKIELSWFDFLYGDRLESLGDLWGL